MLVWSKTTIGRFFMRFGMRLAGYDYADVITFISTDVGTMYVSRGVWKL